MNWAKTSLALTCFVPLIVGALTQSSPQSRASFARDVAPVFRVSCVSCHSEDSAMAGLDLSSVVGIKKSRVIVPGDAKGSILVQRLRGHGGLPQMPMGFKPLDEAVIRKIEQWINEGANTSDAGEKIAHWAYIAPRRPYLPRVENKSWSRNSIDLFVLQRLEQEGLTPSRQADKATLLRRVYLDLIGLPPSIEEVEAYLRDTRPGAYERLVDRLLSSPHFGEQQAVGWLDLARYADSNGYEKDARRTIWPYRDWVINAFNKNMPYDQFTIEQIAGDMLNHPTLDQLIATGFNRNTMLNEEGGVDRDEQRWLTLVDRVGTTSTVWLGTTMACAQCHDHKYDPIKIEEFYEFLAFFDNSDEPTVSVLDPVTQERVNRLGAKIAELEKILPQLKQDSEPFMAATKALNEIRAEANSLNSLTTLILKEKESFPPTTKIRLKGTFTNPGPEVAADTPDMLPKMTTNQKRDRLGLANWLVDKRNPLTARVFVNRIWQQYFGVGLVATSGDFGAKGALPSHPELLDWLAVEFMENGWDMKHVHRLIVTSATYRQSSDRRPQVDKIDPENRLLSRFARTRLPAETIRDNALAASGLLSKRIGGPSVFPDQPAGVWKLPYNGDTWQLSEGDDKLRRGLYTFWRRSAPYPAFVNFDAMSREGCTVKREMTNTPLQALTTLNDEAFMRASRSLAKRMLEVNGELKMRIEVGFRMCVVRRPSPDESNLLVEFYKKQLLTFGTDEERARMLIAQDAPLTSGSTLAESAAMVMLANVLLNLDETITKE